jgi:hypothetical protein
MICIGETRRTGKAGDPGEDLANSRGGLEGKEEKLARLKKEVETFPARLQKEIDASVLVAHKEVEVRHEHQMVLTRKDAKCATN